MDRRGLFVTVSYVNNNFFGTLKCRSRPSIDRMQTAICALISLMVRGICVFAAVSLNDAVVLLEYIVNLKDTSFKNDIVLFIN